MTLADRLPTVSAPRVTWHVDAAGLRCSVEWPEGRPPLSRVLPIFERLGLDLVDHVPGEVGDSFGFSEVQDPNPPEMLPLLARGVRRSRAIAAASDGSALLDQRGFQFAEIGSTQDWLGTPGVHGPEETGANRRQRDARFTLRTAVAV